MKKSSKRSEGSTGKAAQASAPIALLVATWLVPGLGHLILGKKKRALVFSAIILAAFITGVILRGALAAPHPGAPFSWLAFFACLGNGILYIAGHVLGFGNGTAADPGFGYGNTFLITAGLMNLLLVLDVSDISRGLKD